MRHIFLMVVRSAESSALYPKPSRSVHRSLSILLFTICLLAAAVPGWAQSTDQSSPTPITANELSIKGPKKNNQQYYYSFTGGPGEVSIALNVKAKSSSTFVGIKVFDAELNTLTYHNMSADTSPSVAMKKFDVGEKQALVLTFTSDGSLGECKIKFGGAVEFGAGETLSAPSPDPAITDTSTTPSTDTPAPTETPSSMVEQSSATGAMSGVGKNKAFTMSILDAVGQRFNIPANGKLRIEMKDGSVQEIDLTQVKTILVKK